MMGFQCLVVILVAQYSYETKQWLLCYLQALINQFNTVQSARSDICQKKNRVIQNMRWIGLIGPIVIFDFTCL